jgi:hypothetical protein
VITPDEIKQIKDELVALAGADLGQYSRGTVLPKIPAIYNGRKAPAGYEMVRSPLVLPAGQNNPLPALEIIFDRYSVPSSKIRNIGAAPIVDQWQLFLIFHDERQRSDLVLEKIINRYKVPLNDIEHVPFTDKNPEQYRLPIVNWRLS